MLLRISKISCWWCGWKCILLSQPWGYLIMRRRVALQCAVSYEKQTTLRLPSTTCRRPSVTPFTDELRNLADLIGPAVAASHTAYGKDCCRRNGLEWGRQEAEKWLGNESVDNLMISALSRHGANLRWSLCEMFSSYLEYRRVFRVHEHKYCCHE